MSDGPGIEAVAGELTAASLFAAGHLKWTLYGPGKLGAFVAEMDFGTAPAVTAALHDAIDAGQLGYLTPGIVAAMQAACVDWQRDAHGWTVGTGAVRPIPNVIRGLEIAIQYFSRPQSAVILPTPAHVPFLAVPAHLGRETIQIEMVLDDGRHVVDLDALDRAFVAGGDMLLLCNPHNPLGRVMERAELAAIAEIVTRHGGRVFADEIHAPLVFPGHRHIPYASVSDDAAGHTVTATSATKAWNLAGLTCAQLIVSNDADRAVIDGLAPFVTNGASPLGAIATTAALTAGRPWLDDVLAYLDGNRHLLTTLLAEHLPEVGYVAPEGTYLAWIDCRPLGLPVAPAEFFDAAADVVLVDGARCGPAGTGFVRLNMATARHLLEQIVAQMGAAARAR